jgi:hypothetical protein
MTTGLTIARALIGPREPNPAKVSGNIKLFHHAAGFWAGNFTIQ